MGTGPWHFDASGLRLLCPAWLGHGGYLGPLNMLLAWGIPKSCFNTKSTKSRSNDLDNLKLPHDWTESLVCFHWVTMFHSFSRHLCHLKASRGPPLVPGTPLRKIVGFPKHQPTGGFPIFFQAWELSYGDFSEYRPIGTPTVWSDASGREPRWKGWQGSGDFPRVLVLVLWPVI